MSDRPLTLSEDEVKAIWSGRQTQIRLPSDYGDDDAELIASPGDKFWIRETWANVAADPFCDLAKLGFDLAYKARDNDEFTIPPKWEKPSAMARSRSRLTLLVRSVRVERLRDASRGDAMASGCPYPNVQHGLDPRLWLCAQWDRKHGKGESAKNPWVEVIDFKLLRGNIDEVFS